MAITPGVVLLVFVLPLLARRYRRWIATHVARLWLASASTLFALAASNLLLPSPPAVPFHLRRPNARFVFDPDPFALPGVSRRAVMSINSAGVRGPEMPPGHSACRILCVGGGTTECLYLDDAETWPMLLGQRLQANKAGGLWVGSAGFSEFGVREHLRFVAGAPIVDRADCLVFLVGASDVLQWLFGYHNGELPRPVLGCTRLGEVVMNLLQADARYLADPDGIQLSKTRRNLMPVARRGDLQKALRDYQKNLNLLMAAVESRQKKALFISQPVLWDDLLPDRAKKKLCYARPPEQPPKDDVLRPSKCREIMDLFNARLEWCCQAHHLPFLDASQLSGDEANFHDDVHLSEVGCQRLADLIAEFLETANWLPAAGRCCKDRSIASF
jgi:lysophospholipase L1-like esterase